jgi:hypothetical protein
MNLDQLIQDADPVADSTIPGPDSPLALKSFERVFTGQPRRTPARQRKFIIPVSAAALTAAAVTAAGAGVALLVTGTAGVPVQSAAAAVLNQAAAAAARQQPVVLQPGEFLYTETRTLHNDFDEVDHKVFVPEYVSTDRSWQTRQGAGKDIYTVVSPVTFANDTRRIWIEAGSPKIIQRNPVVTFMTVKPPVQIPVHLSGKPGQHFMTGEPIGSAIPLENLSQLPTDPAALAQAIQHKKTGLPSVNADIEDPATPAGTFWAAMDILSDQSVGGTPALRSALFKVMAEQPGITNLGSTRTRSGRVGAGLQVTVGHDRAGRDIAVKAIVDPATGQILESDILTNGTVTGWTEYLSTGVVNKIGQLPQK